MWPFTKNIPDLEQLAHQDHPDYARLSGRRVLEMVAELHRKGFEGARISPHTAPSGCFWRCYIVPRGRMQSACQFDHGKFRELEQRATFSTSNGFDPFGWQGVGQLSAKAWAERFVQEFPQICAESRLADRAYVDWFKTMLSKTQDLVVAWDDYQHFDPLRFQNGPGTYPLPPF